MSYRDILSDPRVAQAMRKLAENGIYVTAQRIRRNDVVLLVDLEKTLEHIKNKVTEWVKPFETKTELSKEEGVYVIEVNVPPSLMSSTTQEELENTVRQAQERLRRKGIPAYISAIYEGKILVGIDVDAMAKFMLSKIEATVPSNYKHKSLYDKESMIAGVEVWYGS